MSAGSRSPDLSIHSAVEEYVKYGEKIEKRGGLVVGKWRR
jgi:hypothetical protein